MFHGSRAIVFLVSERGKHCVSGGLARPNFQNALEERSGSTAAGFVFQFGGALERGEVVGGDGEGLVESGERFASAAEFRESDAFERPEPYVFREILELSVDQREGLFVVVRA